jgi:hypothetical protein
MKQEAAVALDMSAYQELPDRGREMHFMGCGPKTNRDHRRIPSNGAGAQKMTAESG